MKISKEELELLNELVQSSGLAAEEAEEAASVARIADSRKNREILRLRAKYGEKGDIDLVTGDFVDPPQFQPPTVQEPKPISKAAKLMARGKR